MQAAFAFLSQVDIIDISVFWIDLREIDIISCNYKFIQTLRAKVPKTIVL